MRSSSHSQIALWGQESQHFFQLRVRGRAGGHDRQQYAAPETLHHRLHHADNKVEAQGPQLRRFRVERAEKARRGEHDPHDRLIKGSQPAVMSGCRLPGIGLIVMLRMGVRIPLRLPQAGGLTGISPAGSPADVLFLILFRRGIRAAGEGAAVFVSRLPALALRFSRVMLRLFFPYLAARHNGAGRQGSILPCRARRGPVAWRGRVKGFQHPVLGRKAEAAGAFGTGGNDSARGQAVGGQFSAEAALRAGNIHYWLLSRRPDSEERRHISIEHLTLGNAPDA